MKCDPRWREQIESLRRAGLDYVSREIMETLVAAKTNIPQPFTQEIPPVLPPQQSNITPVNPTPAIEETVNVASRPKEKTPPNKVEALRLLAAEVAQCTLCEELARTRTQTVFSDGSANAEICFIGEAPGADEDQQGVPFVGKAGQLLTKIIEACKLKREEVYICNVLKCRPPGNRNPLNTECENCRPFLERQLELVKPRMLVTLGKYATAFLLKQKPESTPILKLRGSIVEYCGIPCMITLHPSYLLRNPNAKREVWDDMKTVMRELGRPID